MRINCPQCSEPVMPDAEQLARSGLDAAAVAGFDFRAGAGCAHCRGTGYRGRRAVTEILVLDDTLRELIIAREPARVLKEAARARGTRTLREAGVALVRSGATSLAELNRVTLVG